MWNWLMSFMDVIQQNPIAYSIFGVGLMGTIGYWCKRIPLWIMDTITNRLSILVEITDTPAASH